METEYIDTKTLEKNTVIKDNIITGNNSRIIRDKNNLYVIKDLNNPLDTYKLDFLNQIKLPREVAKAEKIISLDNDKVAYERLFIDGYKIGSIVRRKNSEYIKILKRISDKLKELNKLGYLYSDLYKNIIIEENNKIHFINYEDLIEIKDINNIDNKFINKFNGSDNLDKIYNTYLVNRLAICLLGNVYYYFLDNDDIKNHIRANDDEIDEIIYRTLNLDKLKEEDNIIYKTLKLQKKLKINY